MNRKSYLDAAEEFLPQAEVRLVTYLAVMGILVPLVALGAWRYAVVELRAMDEGTVRVDRRRSIDHARALAKLLSIVYAIVFVIAIGLHA